jgi:Mg2+-importing ATPase
MTDQQPMADPSAEASSPAETGSGHPERGLTSSEAAARLATVGPNEPVHVRRLSTVLQLLRLFLNPLVIILLVASVISFLLGQVSDAVIIVSMVLLGVGINFWQSYRSQQAAERLRAMVTPTATVCRNGKWQEVGLSQIVPGDLIRLSAGDLVPADAQLVESHDLSVQQSMLTGESLPADKHTGVDRTRTGPDAPHLVFLGTSVVSGTATAVVITTGHKTLFGDIAARLSVRPPETEFEHGLRRFSVLILTTTITLVLFIVLVSIAFKHDAFESLLFAVALGVGLTPEFLPMISSVTLTRGALRMARERVIVKHLPAIQNFGSIDILCSDKTGTLTAGLMQVDQVLDPLGAASQRPFRLAFLNSHFETGIRSPFDAAILKHEPLDPAGYAKLDEIPFDFERRRLSVVVWSPSNRALAPLLITKGAPESVIAVSSAIEVDGTVAALDERGRATMTAVIDRLGASGFRVLAIAYRSMDVRPSYAKTDEAELVLAGFLSFADPILPDAAAVLKDMEADGVAVKILTGDHDVVARHVCRQVGLQDDAIINGDELDRLDDAALGHVAEQASVFTRVSPAQKNRIILALKRRGHVVGFLGDGINDAPSLHTADVGVSVMNAADVARQAADIILVEPGLRVLHRGILEGRRASGNMMKYLLMGTSSNFGNMFSMAAASLFLPFLPMLPTQILLNNFLYDLAQITIPSDNVDASYIQRPQRWDMRVIRDFMIFIGPISSVFDFLTFYAMLRIFHASQNLFHTGWFVESLATQTLVLFVIRTMGNPLASRPSRPLAITTVSIVAIGIILPITPLASLLGFTAPPMRYFVLLMLAVVVYLALVELAKRQLVKRLGL